MLNDCYQYVKRITSESSEIGIFEFGVSAVWRNDRIDLNHRHTKGGDTVWEELRFDALLINCRKQYIRGFEFKVNRSDFLRDNKWRKYVKYCNTFSFICPPGIIKKGEIDKGIGLVYVYPSDSPYPETKRIHNSRSKPIHSDIYVKLIGDMLIKAKYRHNQLF